MARSESRFGLPLRRPPDVDPEWRAGLDALAALYDEPGLAGAGEGELGAGEALEPAPYWPEARP